MRNPFQPEKINIDKVKLDEEEKSVKGFVEDLLKKQHVVIEINPEDMSYTVIDEINENYFYIDSIGCQLDGKCFSLHRKLSSNVIDMFKTICKEETVKRRIARKEKLFRKSIDSINNLREELCQQEPKH